MMQVIQKKSQGTRTAAEKGILRILSDSSSGSSWQFHIQIIPETFGVLWGCVRRRGHNMYAGDRKRRVITLSHVVGVSK